jgi:uncharacterized protein (TIGR00369 family)
MPVDDQIMKTLHLPREEPPAARLLGMRFTAGGPGLATFEMDCDERHHNPMGSVHGGVLADIADAALNYAVISTLAPDETFSTLELKVNFLRPVFKERLRCHARVESRGKTIVYATADIVNEDRKVVAKALSTSLVRKQGGDDAFHHRPK